MVTASKEDLYQFELQYPKFELLIKTLLRSYGGLFENYVFINEKDMAFRLKLSTTAITEQLLYLDKNKLLSYIPHNDYPKLVFTQNRVNNKFLEFSPANYKLLKQNYLDKLKAVIDYTNNVEHCRQLQLLRYFGESGEKDCGYCDVCIKKKRINNQSIKEKITGILAQKPQALEDLQQALQVYHYATWTETLRDLLDDSVVEEKEGVYHLKQ
jgi:ATP-dependent DNA helicase RecQ